VLELTSNLLPLPPFDGVVCQTMLTTYRLLRVLLTYAVITCILSSCNTRTMKIIQRVPSPDGLVDAILVIRPTAAIAADVYEVYIVSHLGNPRKRDLILSGDLLSNARLEWNHPRLLELHYTAAYIVDFRNYWQSPDVKDFNISWRSD
jgi:hypothetical protein